MTVAAFTEDGEFCSQSDITYAMSVTTSPSGLDTSWISFNSASREVSWTQQTNSAFIGVYTITITGSILITSTVYSGYVEFPLTVVPTCATTVENLAITGVSPPNQSYIVAETQKYATLSAFDLTSAYCSA